MADSDTRCNPCVRIVHLLDVEMADCVRLSILVKKLSRRWTIPEIKRIQKLFHDYKWTREALAREFKTTPKVIGKLIHPHAIYRVR